MEYPSGPPQMGEPQPGPLPPQFHPDQPMGLPPDSVSTDPHPGNTPNLFPGPGHPQYQMGSPGISQPGPAAAPSAGPALTPEQQQIFVAGRSSGLRSGLNIGMPVGLVAGAVISFLVFNREAASRIVSSAGAGGGEASG